MYKVLCLCMCVCVEFGEEGQTQRKTNEHDRKYKYRELLTNPKSKKAIQNQFLLNQQVKKLRPSQFTILVSLCVCIRKEDLIEA